jgi:hypothetical protein
MAWQSTKKSDGTVGLPDSVSLYLQLGCNNLGGQTLVSFPSLGSHLTVDYETHGQTDISTARTS